MTPVDPPAMRRVTVTLRRSALAPALGVRPTIVIEGRSQPTQWGEGTWLLPADRTSEVRVYLYWRGLTWGRASRQLAPDDPATLTYRLGMLGARFA